MENAQVLESEITDRYDNAKLNPEWPPLEPQSLFLSTEEIFLGLKNHPRTQLLNLNLKSVKHVVDYDCQAPRQFNLNPRSESPVSYTHLTLPTTPYV